MLIIVIIIILLFLIFYNLDYFSNTVKTNNIYVCMFAYYEKNDMYKENLNYFIQNGIYNDVDYYIIVNGSCTVNIPNKPNLHVIYRENKGYDFGAWNYCINNILDKKYEYYVFLNSSVRGPYLDKNKNWLVEYLKLFNTRDVKLVGSSINILNYYNHAVAEIYKHNGPYTHVQSMFFILNKEGFEFLKNIQFFNKTYDNFNEVIIYKEIGMSQLILKNNWNINCILSKYRDYDYRKVKQNFNPTGSDPYLNNTYFGKTIKPHEVIFYKNNRNLVQE